MTPMSWIPSLGEGVRRPRFARSEQKWSRSCSGTGSAILTQVRRAWVVAGIPLAMGCLVASDIEVPEPVDCPPSIESTPTAAFPKDRVAVVGVSTSEPIVFEVQVRDCNQNQTLEWVLALNPTMNRFPDRSGTIAADQRESLRVEVPLGEFAVDECSKVDLLVSGAFRFIPEFEPESAGDLGTATWHVAVVDDTSETTPTIDFSDCPESVEVIGSGQP